MIVVFMVTECYEGCNFILKYIHADTQPVRDVCELKIRLLEALGTRLKFLSLRCCIFMA